MESDSVRVAPPVSVGELSSVVVTVPSMAAAGAVGSA
jgi:hypothetical protein